MVGSGNQASSNNLNMSMQRTPRAGNLTMFASDAGQGAISNAAIKPSYDLGPSNQTRSGRYVRSPPLMSAAGDSDFTVSGGAVGVDNGYQDRQFSGPDTGYNEKLLNASKMERVKGARLITAVKTPYAYSGRIDLNAFDRIVDFQLQNGVEGLVVGGTTGEGHLMNWDEHLTLIEHCSAAYGD